MFFALLVRLLLKAFFYRPHRRPQRLGAKEFARMFAPMTDMPSPEPAPMPLSATTEWGLGVSL